MGQAVTDLPDPLEDRPEPAGSNDELLSQLAGDEIDRLLAEEGDPADSKLSSGRSLDEAASAPSSVDADLGGFLNNLDQGHRPSDPLPADLPDSQAPQAAIESPGPSDPSSEALLSDEADLAERAALDDALREDAQEIETSSASSPLLLRPLVWLNAPLDFLPEGIRAGVGKVALITFFNALAILAYVLIFRS